MLDALHLQFLFDRVPFSLNHVVRFSFEEFSFYANKFQFHQGSKKQLG